MKSSEYINVQRKFYSLYVLQSRAIPLLADGLKAAARRVLWVARNGDKYKTATLAGRALPLHPHAPPEGAVNTLAAPYGNNIPLFTGSGAFGTMLNPTAYGAARYTSVKISQFTKEVVFKDIDLVPMVENYDGTELEPQHLLPLVPLIVLNPTSGIAVGFATNILPRSLEDIINLQIKVLRGQKRLPTLTPTFEPTNDTAISQDGSMYYFKGDFERINTTTIRITSFPYNTSHEKYTEHLEKLIEQNKIIDYVDNSKDVIDIEVKFKRGQLAKYTDEKVFDLLKLITRESENLTYIDVDGETVQTDTAEEAVRKFTEWRLEWYYNRYEKLLAEVEEEIQRYKDILLAIKKNVGGVAKKVENRKELIEFLTEIGVVNVEYIAGFPVYRFTVEEKRKTEEKLVEATARAKKYNDLLKSEEKRRNVYIDELKNVLQQYRKGTYQSHQ
jgi:DNA topoisomerase-2